MEKILIVDDEKEIAELESYLLKSEGYETKLCFSGEEALEEMLSEEECKEIEVEIAEA